MEGGKGRTTAQLQPQMPEAFPLTQMTRAQRWQMAHWAVKYPQLCRRGPGRGDSAPPEERKGWEDMSGRIDQLPRVRAWTEHMDVKLKITLEDVKRIDVKVALVDTEGNPARVLTVFFPKVPEWKDFPSFGETEDDENKTTENTSIIDKGGTVFIIHKEDKESRRNLKEMLSGDGDKIKLIYGWGMYKEEYELWGEVTGGKGHLLDLQDRYGGDSLMHAIGSSHKIPSSFKRADHFYNKYFQSILPDQMSSLEGNQNPGRDYVVAEMGAG